MYYIYIMHYTINSNCVQWDYKNDSGFIYYFIYF